MRKPLSTLAALLTAISLAQQPRLVWEYPGLPTIDGAVCLYELPRPDAFLNAHCTLPGGAYARLTITAPGEAFFFLPLPFPYQLQDAHGSYQGVLPDRETSFQQGWFRIRVDPPFARIDHVSPAHTPPAGYLVFTPTNEF